MQIIPLQAVKNQTVSAILGGQNCRIEVFQTDTFGLFCNVYADGVLIVQGVSCLDRNLIVRDAYLGFVGDFCFIDNQGTTDPYYVGLGDRFSLAYLTPEDVAAAAAAYAAQIAALA